MPKRRQAVIALVIVIVGLGAATFLIPSVRRLLISSNNDKAFALMNHDRTQNSPYPALAHQSQLQAYAQNWSNHMAKTGVLEHDSIDQHICCWRALGENVGQGPTLGDIEYSFMQSPEHRRNILYPTFTQAGVGVAISYDSKHNPIYWVTQAFRYPTRTASRAAPRARSSFTPRATFSRRPSPLVSSTPKSSPKPTPSMTPSTTPSASVFVPPPVVAQPAQHKAHHRGVMFWVLFCALVAFIVGMAIVVGFGLGHRADV